MKSTSRWLRPSRLPSLAVALLAVVLAGCTSTPASPSGGAPVTVAEGGTLTLGAWQAPISFLDAGVVGDLPFADVLAAPVQEGLLWYRSSDSTAVTATEADYWAPDLATEVPTLANGDVKTAGCADAAAAMCVTWKLRQGVRWDDGSALGAQDVCATFELRWLRFGAPGKPNPTPVAATAGWDQVIKCTVADDLTAVVDFKTAYGPYLALGSGVDGILPASLLEPALATGSDLQGQSTTFDLTRGSGNRAAFRGAGSLDTVLDGTGPFVLSSYTPGVQVVMVRNRNYWNSADLPHLDKLVFRIEPDLATEVRDVLSGAVQVGFDLRLANLPALRAAARRSAALLKVDAVPGAGAEMIVFNVCASAGGLCDNPAVQQSAYTDDATIRRAILLGIDRQAIIDSVARGLTVVPRDSWMYLGAGYLESTTIPQTGFSLQQANSLLDSAGDARDAKCGAAPDGQSYRRAADGSCIVIDLGTTSDDPVRVRVESMIRDDLAKIGINVPAAFTPNLPGPAFFDTFADSGPLATHAFDMAMYSLGIGLPGEPDTYSSSWHGDCGGGCPQAGDVPSSAHPGAGANVGGLNDKQLDADLDSARGTADPSRRAGDYVLAEKRLATLLPAIPLYRQVIVDTLSTRLFGVQQNPLVWDFDTADWYCAGGICG